MRRTLNDGTIVSVDDPKAWQRLQANTDLLHYAVAKVTQDWMRWCAIFEDRYYTPGTQLNTLFTLSTCIWNNGCAVVLSLPASDHDRTVISAERCRMQLKFGPPTGTWSQPFPFVGERMYHFASVKLN